MCLRRPLSDASALLDDLNSVSQRDHGHRALASAAEKPRLRLLELRLGDVSPLLQVAELMQLVDR